MPTKWGPMSEIPSAASHLPPPGWYPDPEHPEVQLRHWDGGAWSAQTRPLAPQASTDPVGSPRAGGGRSMPITLAGAALVIGGIAGAVAEWISPSSLEFTIAIASLIGLALYFASLSAAYFLFAQAGFPYRSTGMSIVTYGLALAYLVLLALFVMLGLTGDTVWEVVLGLTGLAGSVLAIVFTVATFRNLMLPTGFRILVLAQLLLTMLANSLAYFGVLGASGAVSIIVGAAFIVLAGNTRAALEAAAAGTDDQRERLRAARKRSREAAQ